MMSRRKSDFVRLVDSLIEVFLIGLTFIALIIIAGAGLMWLISMTPSGGC